MALSALSAAPSSSGALTSSGRLFVVQAVPGTSYAVWVDGEQEQDAVGTGTVVGPLELTAGTHSVRFGPDQGQAMTADVRVRAGASTDLVLRGRAVPAVRDTGRRALGGCGWTR